MNDRTTDCANQRALSAVCLFVDQSQGEKSLAQETGGRCTEKSAGPPSSGQRPEARTILRNPYAGVAKLADAQDLKSWDPKGSCGFDPRPRH